MKLTDLKIGTQLGLGLGTILLLVTVLGGMVTIQTRRLADQAQTMVDHPLEIRQALWKLEVAAERMDRHMRDLLVARNDPETAAALQAIAIERADVEHQFAILDDRYFGPRQDVTTLHNEFIKWNALREETILLVQTGKASEVEARLRSGGIQGAQAAVIRNHLDKVYELTRSKSQLLHQEAVAMNDTANRQSAVMYALVLLASAIIAWFLLKAIKAPIAELTTVAEQFRHGKLDGRSRYASSNELGALSAAFNTMADTIQTEIQVNEKATQLASVMLREETVRSFCRELLKSLLHHTGSQIGAIYFLNEAKTTFDHFESIGLGAGARAAFSATELEGELGAALTSGRIEHITDIPADTRFTFAAVSGDFKPREILTIPVLFDRTVSAVISLASLHRYDTASVRLVNGIWSVLTARMNGVLAFRRIQDLAERLDHQNRELDAQKRELSTQASELTEQNTELEMQKQQLGEANRLKSAFLSNMSHELRTPLNSVIALAGVLNRRLADRIPAEEYGYLDIIERNGKHLLALINDILDLSRIEAGREELSISRFSIRDLATEIVAMIEPQAYEKNITLVNRIPADLPPIASDSSKLLHILQNLVGNAVKFTEQGQVAITAEIPRSAPSEIRISVTDTGIGIAATDLPYIFEEFRQADGSTSRKYGGSGLGLAIAKKYALLLGGSIAVESAPGQGSTFTLRLPLLLEGPGAGQATEIVRTSSAYSTSPAPALPGQGQDILVVEDNEPAIIQLTDILQAQGYRVHVVRNGKEALAQIGQTLPSAMILDLMMPEVDGFQVLKVLRSDARSANLPVLILTAKHMSQKELSFLKGNHIYELIQKGDIDKAGVLAAVGRMFAPAPVALPAPRRLRPTHPGKPVILVVEDNPDSMRTARALLKDRYQILEAIDGPAAVEQATQHHPDLILTDIGLPGMDGVEVLKELRKDETLCRIPVIALTASAMKGDRETILAHGFDGYLSKPVDAVLLMKILNEALD